MKVSLIVGVNSRNVVQKMAAQKKNDEKSKNNTKRIKQRSISNEAEWKCERPLLNT